MTASKKVLFFTTVISLVLLIPIFGITYYDNANLENLHNRSLSKLPAKEIFIQNPVLYFSEANKYLADRAYPIISASALYKNILLYLLKTAPQKRVTMGRDGFIFLNGSSEESINGLFEAVCVYPHNEENITAFRNSLPSIEKFSKDRNIPIDIVFVATSATIYGDYLPLSVPKKYRDACLEGAMGRSPLLSAQTNTNPFVVYPLKEMIAARNDPAFFPKGNWHAIGLSIKVVRDTYLSRLGYPKLPMKR